MKSLNNLLSQKGIISFLVILLLTGSYIIFSINKPYDFDDSESITAEALNTNFDILYDRVTELEAMINNPPPGSVPAGTIVAFGGDADSVPAGWLLCDGTPYSGTDYYELYAAIGTNFGSMGGDIFNVPDLRGMFLRGVDGGAGKDPDLTARTINGDGETDAPGSVQVDNFKKHDHYVQLGAGSETSSYLITRGGNFWNSVVPSQDTSITGGNETRPKNVYVHYIIKY